MQEETIRIDKRGKDKGNTNSNIKKYDGIIIIIIMMMMLMMIVFGVCPYCDECFCGQWSREAWLHSLLLILLALKRPPNFSP